jgi:hypothetical protein
LRAERVALIGCLTLAGPGWGQQPGITIKLENTNAVPLQVLARAQATAEEIYAGIGLNLKWSSRHSAHIRIQFDYGVAPNVHPGALAYALPYGQDGVRIHILFDRTPDRLIGKSNPAWYRGVVLGHVIAHELAHVLEGLGEHSDSGVMKAHWDDRDFNEMKVHVLAFSAADVRSIREAVTEGASPANRYRQ